MSNISEITDRSEFNNAHISYHDVRVKAHHVEMENVLGTNWRASGDDKCKTVWTFMFTDDSGDSFPASVYDWKEYDDYYKFTNHYYHIGTRTTSQSKLVAEYIESQILDFMKITRSQFYFNKPEMAREIKAAIDSFCRFDSDSDLTEAVIQIYNNGKIEIGNDIKLCAKNVFEHVVMLLDDKLLSIGIIECDMAKIDILIESMSSYFYYQYLNSIQTNRAPGQ